MAWMIGTAKQPRRKIVTAREDDYFPAHNECVYTLECGHQSVQPEPLKKIGETTVCLECPPVDWSEKDNDRNERTMYTHFSEAYAEGVLQARRRSGDDQFVFAYRDGDGFWHVAQEGEDIPQYLHYTTEGYLLIHADMQVGICSGLPAPPRGEKV